MGVFALLYQRVQRKGVGEHRQRAVECRWMLQAGAADFAAWAWAGRIAGNSVQTRLAGRPAQPAQSNLPVTRAPHRKQACGRRDCTKFMHLFNIELSLV